ncbi:restriction endonuclease subunit S [Lactococcus petauri]|nr:restriction endonuclease subunit S [Lactococcus petauri]
MSEKMKDSGVDWIGEIPDGWEVTALKNVVQIKNGREVEHDTSKGYPVYGSGGIFKYTDKYLYEGESVLLGRKGTIDNPQYISGKFWTVDTSYYTITSEKLNTKLFYYQTLLFDYQFFQTGSTLPSMTQRDLGSIKLPLPLPSKQVSIVNYLDKQTSKFDQAQKLLKDEIERLRAYKKSLIYETVTKGLDKNVQFKDSGVDWIGEIPEGWEVKRLKYVIEIKDGTHDTPEYVNEGIPLITSKNLNSEYNEIDFSTTKNISILDSEKINKRSNVEQGDILMPMIGTVGGAVQVKTDNIFSIKNVALFKTSNDFELSGYLFYYLNSELTNLQFKHVMSGGVQSFVSLAILSELKVVVPPREVLSKVVSHLDEKANKINQIIKIKEQQLANLSEQRKTLIYEVVTGKRGI